jgi:enoyl-CoA hydratase/carnithine racemase
MNQTASVVTDQSFAEGKILKSVVDGVGIITFNNPEKRNAMSQEMWVATGELLEAFRDDPNVRVVVLTGAGGKAFISGADISQFEKVRRDNASAEEYLKRANAPRLMLASYPKPTIASIQGFCVGGGLALAMAADIRIASHGSQFGVPAAKLGISYGYENLSRMVQLIGPSRARLLMYTGMRISAAEADKIGLADMIVPDTDVWGTTMEIARQIAANAPLSVAASQLTIREALKDPAERNLDAIQQITVKCNDSEDLKEGRTAFMEKRKPVFKGR